MLKISVSCGCGFRAVDIDSAVAHAEDTGHQLTLSGTLTSEAPGVAVKRFNRAKEVLITHRLRDELLEDVRSGRYVPQGRRRS